MKTIEIMLASDDNDYLTLFVDGKREWDDSDDYIMANAFSYMAQLHNDMNHAEQIRIIFKHFQLYDLFCSDIPDEIKTFKDMQNWLSED